MGDPPFCYNKPGVPRQLDFHENMLIILYGKGVIVIEWKQQLTAQGGLTNDL